MNKNGISEVYVSCSYPLSHLIKLLLVSADKDQSCLSLWNKRKKERKPTFIKAFEWNLNYDLGLGT